MLRHWRPQDQIKSICVQACNIKHLAHTSDTLVKMLHYALADVLDSLQKACEVRVDIDPIRKR